MKAAPASASETYVGEPPERPLIIFDGDCNFCRRWIARWQRATGARVDYLQFQKLGDRFPEIPKLRFEAAVQLILPTGAVLSGSDAVFRLFDFSIKRPWLLRLLLRVPGFRSVSRATYRFIARHRVFFSRVSRLLFRDP